MIGEVLGNFKFVSKLGAGGMGEVYLAEHTKIGTKVAIKLLRPELSADKAHVDRFFNEALAVSRIRHAGIVKIFDVGHHDKTGAAYLIMEFLEGESLAGRIARVGKLPQSQICDIGRQSASILDATHAEGITHRDLKPDNIFLVKDAELASRERVKILDFGIAKLTGTMAGASPKTVGVMGTPGYMAPEQWGDSSKVDWRADTYSLGCVVFEMACGRQPFIAHTFPEAYAKHLTEPPPPARTLVPELPEPLEKLLDTMLAKKPEDRPAMAAIAERFEAIAKLPPSTSASTAVVPPTIVGHETPTPAPMTPVTEATPVTPAATTPVTEPKPVTPATTLGASTGQVTHEEQKKSKAGLFAIGGLVAVGGVVAIVMATRGGGDKATTKPVDAAVAQADAAAPDAAVVVSSTLRERIEKSNPFVDDHGIKLQTHQVTHQEYIWYEETLTEDEGALARPLVVRTTPPPPPPPPDDPVTWITFERARRFCEAIGASLPTDDQWVRAADGKWGLDPAKRGTLGPLEEWTSTVKDGLAIVRGAHSGMSEDDKQLAMESPMMKSTEALAGLDNPKLVASNVIGFRCAR